MKKQEIFVAFVGVWERLLMTEDEIEAAVKAERMREFFGNYDDNLRSFSTDSLGKLDELFNDYGVVSDFEKFDRLVR